MSVIPITVLFSLGLVFIFVALFWREQRRHGASAERDSLLPLADELPRVEPLSTPVPAPEADPVRADHHHPHHDRDGCGCRDGLRPACAGCLRRTATA